ncbi:MAG: uroporphyrinogen-III decarboxylase [Chloroflexi bacterium]|nr:uroporphyrinogen-III decarboxylase [Chloroflexota bacterium]
MTHRERALAALQHGEADRVPIDLGSLRIATLHVVAQRRLQEYLGLDARREKFTSATSQTVFPDERLLIRFGADFRGLCPNPPSNWQFQLNPVDNSFVDEWGIKWVKPPESLYFDIASAPLAFVKAVDDLERYHWPDPRDPARFAGLADKAREIYEGTDYALAISGPMGGQLIHHSSRLMGLENFFTNLAANEPLVQALLEKVLEFQIAFWDAMLDAVGPYAHVVETGDDLGAQNGPLMNPKTYRRIYKKAHQKLISFIKSKADVKVLFHSCGSVYQFIPDFLEVGIDALNPVQYQTRDMDTKRLKSEFGDRLTFWGGACESQHTLPFGTPEEVREEARKRIADLAPGGGFVFAAVHNIQADVPPANIVALFDTALEFGRYVNGQVVEN